MTSGYRMTEHEFPAAITGFGGPPYGTGEPWRFLAIEAPMQRRQGIDFAHEQLMNLLGVSKAQEFKLWKLKPALRAARIAGIGLLALHYLAMCFLALDPLATVKFPQRYLGIFGFVLAAVLVVPTLIRKFRFAGMGIGASVVRMGIGLSMGLVGWLAAWIHLALFDPWYLRLGRLERLGLSSKPAVSPSQRSK
jgi:hypothetical protein